MSYQSALSVLAATRTELLSAHQPKRGTSSMTLSRNVKIRFCSLEMESDFAPSGSHRAAATKTTQTAISALGAAPQPMALPAALVHRSRAPPTPYKADAWEHHLHIAGLLPRFATIPSGLRHGFILNFPPIYRTQTPPNKNSIIVYNQQFTESIRKEILKGRYLGPYPLSEIESTLGPFQSSPLSIVPKAGRPGKFRLIQNFSFPLSPTHHFPNSSINSHINADDFPTTWGKFSTVYLLISRLPPGSEAATRDVAEAYRTIPLHKSQWPGAVVRISESQACIDTFTAFGVTPAAGAYGHMADAGCEIMRSHGIGPIEKWVDDHVFFRIRREFTTKYNTHRTVWRDATRPSGLITSGSRIWFKGSMHDDGSCDEFSEDCSFPIRDLSAASSRSRHDQLFTYNFDDIDSISDSLGIPWEKSKDQPFGSTTIYIGFLWDITNRRVSLTPPKINKYLTAIQTWQSRPSHVLQDVRELYGKLLHTCSAIPRGRSYLTGFERMLGTCARKPFMPHRPDKAITADLLWWADTLSSGAVSRPILPPAPSTDPQAFSDASSGIGLAITIGSHWRAWRLLPGWQTRDGQKDIGWAEAVAFELLVCAVSSMDNIGPRTILHGDNTGVVEGWKSGRHRNRATNLVFRRIHTFLHALPNHLHINTRYVPSESNPADGPSRGILGPLDLLLPNIPISPELEPFLIDALNPPSPAELAALQSGLYSPPAAKVIN